VKQGGTAGRRRRPAMSCAGGLLFIYLALGWWTLNALLLVCYLVFFVGCLSWRYLSHPLMWEAEIWGQK